MTKIPETVQAYSEYAAKEYLQTVVFIDDRIYERSSGSVPGTKEVQPPKARKKVTESASNNAKSTRAATIDEEEKEYSPHDIVNSFAKKQIICSLYQPNKDAKMSRGSDIFPLCLAADIAIVDWDMYSDGGDRALELIAELINQAVRAVPEQLRLILVYTQEVNLLAVANRLFKKVNDGLGDEIEPIQEEGKLAFKTANSRVSVLGKTGNRSNEYVDHVVEEKELADVAVKQFAKLADGLLQAATLLGLAEIKKNSRKVLSRFNNDLDPAFLTHLAMGLPAEDASEHITPLFISEIESVLQDVLPAPLISEALRRDWCRNVWKPGSHLDALLNHDDQYKLTRAESICTQGFNVASEEFEDIPKLNGKKNIRKAAKILLKSGNDDANHRFSHLMASRTFYDNESKPKALKLGVVVHREEDCKYLLCIQPVCDSVRLESCTEFLFVELSKVEEDSDKPFSHIVKQKSGKFVKLHYKPKSYLCCSAKFKPDVKTKQVLAKQLIFLDTFGQHYEWIDELKVAHAQRAVEQFARDLSRVGLTESEWSRRPGQK